MLGQFTRATLRNVFMVLFAGVLVASCDSATTAPPATTTKTTQYDLADVPRSALVSTADVDVPVTASPVPGPGQSELVVNGSFETNDGVGTKVFAGWSSVSAAGGDQTGFRVQTGTVSPPVEFPAPAPPAGNFTAMSAQAGPGAHVLSQAITIPANSSAQLSFKLFVGNRAGANFSPPTLSHSGDANQQFRMDIMSPTAPVDDVGTGVLLNVYQTQPGDPLVFGAYITVTADLSAFSGQTVVLRFAETDNQLWYNAGIDDVSVIATTLNTAPVFTGATPANGTTLIVKSGQNVQFKIEADDPDAGQTVTASIVSGLPTGATLTNAGPADPVSATVSWTPTASAAGTHAITFEAKDALGASTGTRTVTISAGGVITVNVRQLNMPLPNGIAGLVVGLVRTSDLEKFLAISDAAGNVTFGGLDNANYCVWAKPLSSIKDATVDGSSLVPPPDDFLPGTPAQFEPAVTGPGDATLDYSVANFIE